MKRYLIVIFLLLGSISAKADELESEHSYVHFTKPQLKLVETFQDWEVYHQIFNNNVQCHAISSPYKTKAFDGVREAPYLIVSFKGRNQYTISLSSGFFINKQSGVILQTNNRSYLLNSTFPRAAWTYSSSQDAAIINDIIKDGRSLSIRSYDLSDDIALDFYSLKGILEALQYMEKSCLIFYN